MFRGARRLAALVFLISAGAVPAHADPIVVTGGSTFLYWDGSGTSVRLQGDGLSVVTDAYGGGIQILPSGVTDLDGTLTFGSIGTAAHLWTVTLEGTQYAAYLGGSLDFDTAPVVIPPTPGRNEQLVTFTTPFTMTGGLRGTSGPLGTGSVLFDVLLTGTGTASAHGFAADTNLYRIGGVSYQFAPADVAATPEPATLLLMGTGVAGVLMRRRRQSREPRA